MDETSECRHVEPLLAELATGVLTDLDRDRALRHVNTCASCQRELAELSRAADGVLWLVPEREPPAGFETAVMNRITDVATAARPVTAATPRRIHWRVPGWMRGRALAGRPSVRLAAGALALVLAAATGAAVAYWHGGTDRELAGRYRQAVAAGRPYTNAAPVTSTDGSVVGHMYVYPGSPPWAIVSLTAAPVEGAYQMSITTTSGVRYPVGVCTVTGHTGVAGYPLATPVDQIARVDLDHADVHLTIRPG